MLDGVPSAIDPVLVIVEKSIPAPALIEVTVPRYVSDDRYGRLL